MASPTTVAAGDIVLSNVIRAHQRIQILEGEYAGQTMTVSRSTTMFTPATDTEPLRVNHVLYGLVPNDPVEISLIGMRPVRYLGDLDLIDLTVQSRQRPGDTFSITQYEGSLTSRLEVVYQGDRLTLEVATGDRASRHLTVQTTLGFDLDRDATLALIAELQARVGQLDASGWSTSVKTSSVKAS